MQKKDLLRQKISRLQEMYGYGKQTTKAMDIVVDEMYIDTHDTDFESLFEWSQASF